MNIAARPCILIAEDEMTVAMMLEDLMQMAGYRVLLTARVSRGLDIVIAETIDAAILDINLAGHDSFPLADALRLRGIPILFASGYGSEGLPERYRNYSVLQKPYSLAQLKAALVALLANKGSRPA